MFVFGARPRLACGMNEQDEDYGTEPLLPEWLTRRRLYRGWWVVILGFFLLAVSARAQVETGFALLMDLDRPRVVARQDGFPTNTEYYLLIVVILVLAPVVGLVVDRFGPIVVILPVMVGSAIAFATERIIDEFWLQRLTWMMLWGVLAGSLLIGFIKAVTSWFIRHRGIALAALLAGVMVAPAIPFPRIHSIAYWLIPYDYSRGVWPDTRMIQVIDISILLVIGIIPAYFLLRSRFRNSWSARRESFILTDNQEADEEEEPNVAPVDSKSPPLKSTLMSRSYLLLLAASGLQASAIVLLPSVVRDFWAYSTLLSPLRVSVSLWPTGGALIYLPLTGIIVLLTTGVLADRFGGRRVVLGTIVTQLVCVIVLALGFEGWNILAFHVAIGAGVGVLCVSIVVLLFEYWGFKHFGLLLGTIASFTLGAYWLGSRIYYSAAMAMDSWFYGWLPFTSMALLFFALVLILLIKRPQYRNATAESEPQVAV